ncbi:DUF6647 family protein [Actibacterium sp. MT2.3-13A]|uniref:DUF6647 family protein n=1 Tax=Actibacterium sp. MT2.3-13A TaxID=2828332 RepID=UPI001BAA27BB|nr:DUF6647 family protein [Actibacterium sp. MT2.3-13A]
MLERLRLGLALLACLAAPPASAQLPADSAPAADCPRPDRADALLPPEMPSPALVAELILWIGEETGYDTAEALEAPPEILFCLTGEEIGVDDEDMLVEENMLGAYDLARGRVFLVRPWSEGDSRQVSVLLHELAHHVQFLNRGFDCRQAAEWEAYQLQAKWLAERGVEPAFDWLHIYFLSRCPRDIHP